MVSLQSKQHAEHDWHSKSVMHRAVNEKDAGEKTTEPPLMRVTAYNLQ